MLGVLLEPLFRQFRRSILRTSPGNGVLRSSSWQTQPRPPLHIALARMEGTRSSQKNRRLGPCSNLLSGEYEGENVGDLATIEGRKYSRKRRYAMADRSDATNPTRREPSP